MSERQEKQEKQKDKRNKKSVKEAEGKALAKERIQNSTETMEWTVMSSIQVHA